MGELWVNREQNLKLMFSTEFKIILRLYFGNKLETLLSFSKMKGEAGGLSSHS